MHEFGQSDGALTSEMGPIPRAMRRMAPDGSNPQNHFLPVAQISTTRMDPEYLYGKGLGQKSDWRLEPAGTGLESHLTQSRANT